MDFMKLDVFAKIIGIINNIVWTVIGISIIVLGVFFVSSGYKYLTNMNSSSQTNLPQLSEKDLKCIEDAIGKTRFEELASGSGATPSPDEQVKLSNCFPKN